MTEVEKNKVTILDFWASWCGPCRQEMPFMLQLYEANKNRGLGIVGISLDKDKNAWVSAIKNLKLPWPQMSDLKYWDNDVAKAFNVTSIPHTIVVDQKGKILRRGLRGEELKAFIESELNK
jgi:thiol-disulfide isomerase/thioredoxin